MNLIRTLALTASLLIAGIACQPSPQVTHAPTTTTVLSVPTTTEVIYEDDPRWDCHTMGNLICGSGH